MSKAKVMDPNRMEHIYSETVNYKKKALNVAEEIKRETKALSDPNLYEGMRGGQGDTATAAIKNIAKSAENLAERAVQLAKFLDTRIEGLAMLKKDKAGFGGASAQAAAATNGLRK